MLCSTLGTRWVGLTTSEQLVFVFFYIFLTESWKLNTAALCFLQNLVFCLKAFSLTWIIFFLFFFYSTMFFFQPESFLVLDVASPSIYLNHCLFSVKLEPHGESLPLRKSLSNCENQQLKAFCSSFINIIIQTCIFWTIQLSLTFLSPQLKTLHLRLRLA